MGCQRCNDGSIACSRSPDPCTGFQTIFEASATQEPITPDEDKCHVISVLVKEQGEQCEARLWVGPPDPPPGWENLGSFELRVRAGKDASGDCAVRIYWDDCEGSEQA